MPIINTVLGPIGTDQLGKTLMHEHMIYGFPGWYGDSTCAPFDREACVHACVSHLEAVKRYGVQTIVDPCTNDTGRFPDVLREISARSGINIICCTGYHNEAEGATAYFRSRASSVDATPEIYEMFVKEITEGIADTGIKSGVIKVASSDGRITDYERMFFKAAAKAQRETGTVILTHTTKGNMGIEQIELLVSAGADPQRVMIGHMSDNVSIAYHRQILATGAYDGIDRLGIQGLWDSPMDVERIAVIIGLVGIGHIDQIILSHDTIAHWLGRPRPPFPEALRPLLTNRRLTHVFENIIPALKEGGLTDGQIDTILVDNPRRLFAGEQ